MATGTAYINTSGNKHLFKQIDQFTPPLLVIFFEMCIRDRFGLIMVINLTIGLLSPPVGTAMSVSYTHLV